jgi:dTDP-4-amino-4,6-dideoxygalactose transaminase
LHFWNCEFLDYETTPDGRYLPSRMPVTDCAGSLEWLSCALAPAPHGRARVPKLPAIGAIAELLDKLPAVGPRASAADLVMLADHGRTVALLLGSGLAPGPRGHGHLLRRLIRRMLATLEADAAMLAPLVHAAAAPDAGQFGFPAMPDTRTLRDQLADEVAAFDAMITRGRQAYRTAHARARTPDGLTDSVFRIKAGLGVPLPILLAWCQADGQELPADRIAQMLAGERDASRQGFAIRRGERSTMTHSAQAAVPAIISGHQRPTVTDPAASLLGTAEREALLASFDASVARGGLEGDEVPRFERAFAAATGAAHAIAVSSATTGLQILLSAAGVATGDEVLVPAHTFPASAHAIVHAGGNPVFVDIDRETLCLDPAAIGAAVTERTRAILAVHIGGKPAKMAEIVQEARRHGLVVVEDAAQAHGATLGGRHVGTFGTGGVFSFSPKLMTSFRGGVIVTDDPEIDMACRVLRFHGFSPLRDGHRQSADAARFVHEIPGYSAAMTSMQAAVLMPQLDTLAERVQRRRGNALRLAAGLEAIGGFRAVCGLPDGCGNYYMLEAWYDPEGFGGLPRELAVTALLSEGVPVSPLPLAHMLAPENPSLMDCRVLDHPVATDVRDHGVVFGHPLQSLFLSGDPAYTDDVLDRVALVRASAQQIIAARAAAAERA